MVNMYVIISYDVNSNKCNRIMKLLRKYLFHVQKSVFEGELTQKEINIIKEEVNKIVDENDSVIIYQITSYKALKKEQIKEKLNNNLII